MQVCILSVLVALDSRKESPEQNPVSSEAASVQTRQEDSLFRHVHQMDAFCPWDGRKDVAIGPLHEQDHSAIHVAQLVAMAK